MIEAWRIVSAKRAGHAFDGERARLFGGRWNNPGKQVIYAAGNRALAALELLVHLQRVDLGLTFVRFGLHFPERLTAKPDLSAMMPAIRSASIHPDTQRLGDTWLSEARTPVLRVRSSVIPEEYNYVLNPNHPRFSEVAIGEAERFAFDPRLVGPPKRP